MSAIRNAAFVFCAIAGLSAAPVQRAFGTEAAVVGQSAPNVLLRFVDGTGAELREWLGRRPVFLRMWATWCSTCRAQMPDYKALYDDFGDRIAFFSVNAGFNDPIGEVREFIAAHNLPMPTVIDTTGEIGQAFGLVATPLNIVIDADGAVVHLGHGSGDRVRPVLAGLAAPELQPRRASGPRRSRVPLEPPAAGEGDPAPPFRIRTLAGTDFSLGAAAPRGATYLLFFTTWCESYLAGEGEDREAADACSATRRTLDAAFTGRDSSPRLIGIASRMWTGPEELLGYQAEYRPPYPLALDETNEVFQLYGVRRFPTLIVVADGRIQRRIEGTVTDLPPP